jgi:hypothetical protein
MTNITDNMPKVRTDAALNDTAQSDVVHSSAVSTGAVPRQRMTFKDVLRAVRTRQWAKTR